tara:strand:+ start:165 stop:776 length:612 start_codon:yes stop_codon:yes gene_type:complete
MKFQILLLSIYALSYGYETYIKRKKTEDKIIEEENKFYKNNHTLKFFCKNTHLTNLLFISYIITQIFNLKDLSINIFSVLLPNIIIMTLFYWIFLAKIDSLKSFLTQIKFSNFYLHLISALFAILEYLSCKCEFKLNYLLNLIWTIFCIFMIYLYNNVSKKKMYGLVKVVPGKKMYIKHLIYYVIVLIFIMNLFDKLRFTSFY